MPLLRTRIEAFDRSKETTALFAKVTAACGVPLELVQYCVPLRNDRRLMMLTMRALGLRSLLMAVHRSMQERCSELADAVEALSQHLRRIPSGASQLPRGMH